MVKLLVSLSLIAMILVACDSDPGSPIVSQHWKAVEIHVETRPSPPRPGMAEILIIATIPGGRPAYDLLISLRTANSDPWIQAIQDGHLGVYRRAAEIGIGERSVLQVKVQHDKDETVLSFPLKLSD